MAKLAELWETIPQEACSEDEEVIYPSGKKRYEKLAPYWRNPEVQGFFTTWDHLDISLRYGPDGKPQGKGKFPRVREQPNPPRKNYEASVPQGLPLNFYEPLWYDTLDDMQKEDLGARSPAHLTFPSKILQYVLACQYPVSHVLIASQDCSKTCTYQDSC